VAGDDDEPLWKAILTNEILWVVAAAILVLALAFHLATRGPSEDPSRPASESR
jgi:uncharacterized phage infection (PIP) family protein YhgE